MRETGASVPELEKLIELSQLFQVSLHHLLQVAEPEPANGAAEQPEQLSEGQLAAVNDVLRYQMEQERERQRKRWKKTCWAGVILLLLAVWFGRFQDKSLQRTISQVQDELYWQNNLLDRQVDRIEQTIRTGLEAQSSLVSEYHYKVISINPVQQTCTLEVFAVPRRYVEGMTASFTFSGADFRPMAKEGVLGHNQTFQARVALPLVGPDPAGRPF